MGYNVASWFFHFKRDQQLEVEDANDGYDIDLFFTGCSVRLERRELLLFEHMEGVWCAILMRTDIFLYLSDEMVVGGCLNAPTLRRCVLVIR